MTCVHIVQQVRPPATQFAWRWPCYRSQGCSCRHSRSGCHIFFSLSLPILSFFPFLSPSILCKVSVPSSCCRFALFIESLLCARSCARSWQPQPSCFSHDRLTFSFILARCEPSTSYTINCFCSWINFPRSLIHYNVCRSEFPMSQVLRKRALLRELLA